MTRRAIIEAYRALKTDLPPEFRSTMAVDAKGRPDYTARNNACLEEGIHPATYQKVCTDLGKCGDCTHHQTTGHASRTYHKCDLHRLGMSHSTASDIRVSWPACVWFKPATADACESCGVHRVEAELFWKGTSLYCETCLASYPERGEDA